MNTQLLNHSMQVSSLAMDIALEMELCPYYITQVGLAALYHDIGKECIPKTILDKPDKLTDEEWQVMTFHTYIGSSILQLNNENVSEIVAEAVLNHHEHYDGTGYYKKRYNEVSRAARIIHVADVYSALIIDRPYRLAWEEDEAILYIASNSGKLFDPSVAVAFLSLMDQYADILIEEINEMGEVN